ncbi:hypothetical protein DPEC_G00226490 [Dallia pectoralis]|uniref:Uncharacterized protein n=1 Tax=Dallia pectoralis TaxID=75939 RepID=A0ACC2G122_DALPE|nr:hypothetical protein DPEC_G00226490 [Dallia pectoralis]
MRIKRQSLRPATIDFSAGAEEESFTSVPRAAMERGGVRGGSEEVPVGWKDYSPVAGGGVDLSPTKTYNSR